MKEKKCKTCFGSGKVILVLNGLLNKSTEVICNKCNGTGVLKTPQVSKVVV